MMECEGRGVKRYMCRFDRNPWLAVLSLLKPGSRIREVGTGAILSLTA
jgi:hypothetical protein